MSERVDYKVAKNASEAFEIAKSRITDDYVAQFNIQVDINYLAGENKMNAAGKGFELNLDFQDSYVNVDLTLSFLLKPFKNNVMSRIVDELKKGV